MLTDLLIFRHAEIPQALSAELIPDRMPGIVPEFLREKGFLNFFSGEFLEQERAVMIIVDISPAVFFPDGPADHDLRRRLQSSRKQDPVKILRYIVIAVRKCNEFSRCLPCTQDSGAEKTDIFREIKKTDGRPGSGKCIGTHILPDPLADIPL